MVGLFFLFVGLCVFFVLFFSVFVVAFVPAVSVYDLSPPQEAIRHSGFLQKQERWTFLLADKQGR